MNGIGKNRIDTYDSIISVLHDNKHIVSTVRAFSYSTSKFCKLIDVIKKQEQTLKYEQFRQIFRTSKSKDNLIICLAPFVSALILYYKKTAEKHLCLKYRKITQNYFFSLSDSELLNKAFSICITVEKNFAGLKEYNVTHENLQNLKGRLTDFKSSIGYYREAGYFSDSTESSMEGLFLQADKLLNNLDGYVENLGKYYSVFYNDYVTVRNTENASGKKYFIRYPN